MAKRGYLYECQACGQKYPKWEGRCTSCNEWNTIVEIKEEKWSSTKPINSDQVSKLSDIGVSDTPRTLSGSKEMDRVLGGGLVKGASVLIGGEPGIGKSTLLLEFADRISLIKGQKVLYVTGEESLEQIKIRAGRLGIDNNELLLASDTSLSRVMSTIESVKPTLVIIDSIQAVYDEELSSPMGSFSQLRQTVSSVVEYCKPRDISSFLIGHVTKDGMIAGPKLIEHMVDAVIYFEGEENINYRILRTIKNRFGPSNELGIFEMSSEGLKDVDNPSSFFISERSSGQAGSVVGGIINGSRPLLIEVQSLLSTSYLGMPRRTVVGYEVNRVAMLLAIMEKYLHYSFSTLDIFVNIVGGLKVQEPSMDLAVMISVASAYLGKKLKQDYFIIGEVGLTGEIRKVPRISERILEAERTGFKYALIPDQDTKKLKGDIQIIKVKSIKEVFDAVLD